MVLIVFVVERVASVLVVVVVAAAVVAEYIKAPGTGGQMLARPYEYRITRCFPHIGSPIDNSTKASNSPLNRLLLLLLLPLVATAFSNSRIASKSV